MLKEKTSLNNENNEIDLYDCLMIGDDILLPIKGKDDITESLSELAYEILKYKYSFSKAGFPKDLWLPMVNKYERSEFQKIIHGRSSSEEANKRRYKEWANVLNGYRGTAARELPKVVVQGDCGAGGVEATFRSKPPGARMLFIPTMYYNLCRLQGKDPDDENSCDRWDEVFPGQKVDIAGTYRVKLAWPNRTLIRNFSARKLDEGDTHSITLQ